jgi:hypothetical protein
VRDEGIAATEIERHQAGHEVRLRLTRRGSTRM